MSTLPPSQLHLSTAVQSITSVPALDGHGDHNVELVTALGERIHYDRIIVAAHSDAALSILRAGGGATADEERILGEFEWNKNVAVLHCDKRVRCLPFLGVTPRVTYPCS